ncbi:hypothetical protein TNCV_2520761 [Trichonephila clavipes]|nr:hypothetical protein TNCV_2520761 [Trichonephila clavipes]
MRRYVPYWDRNSVSYMPLATGFFLLLGQQGNKAVLDWVIKEGLIPYRYECPKCKKDMRLVERKGTIDGVVEYSRKRIPTLFAGV